MVWNDHTGMTNKLLKFNSPTVSKEFRTFNYPRAYLHYGLSSFLVSRNDHDLLTRYRSIFDSLVDANGEPVFELTRIDQVPFGLAAINLYRTFNDYKYLKFAHILYEYTLGAMDTTDNIILYRPGQISVLNDVLGMVIPFLIEYSKVTGNSEPLQIATEQIEYFIEYGVDPISFIPAHAINREYKIKIGSANWGRGIGWYYIALASIYKETGLFEYEYGRLSESLSTLTNSEGLWSQFPGSNDTFDASTTTMILYGMSLGGYKEMNSQEVLEKLLPYLSVDGEILQTSGDTYGTNRYSNSFGLSELSQGMLLLLLSNLKM